MSKKLLTSKEVCSLYSISRATLWRRLKAGQIPAPTKINSRNYWLSEQVSEHISIVIGGER